MYLLVLNVLMDERGRGIFVLLLLQNESNMLVKDFTWHLHEVSPINFVNVNYIHCKTINWQLTSNLLYRKPNIQIVSNSLWLLLINIIQTCFLCPPVFTSLSNPLIGRVLRCSNQPVIDSNVLLILRLTIWILFLRD